mmetsp:Transcript_160834/g.390709  ORF Transcript_160834/g.390709 Transcript_160834/m.390709 type:complete len:124 (-) Transcript_160834:209-580(-)
MHARTILAVALAVAAVSMTAQLCTAEAPENGGMLPEPRSLKRLGNCSSYMSNTRCNNKCSQEFVYPAIRQCDVGCGLRCDEAGSACDSRQRCEFMCQVTFGKNNELPIAACNYGCSTRCLKDS